MYFDGQGNDDGDLTARRVTERSEGYHHHNNVLLMDDRRRRLAICPKLEDFKKDVSPKQRSQPLLWSLRRLLLLLYDYYYCGLLVNAHHLLA